ncbi:MAG: vWA domain-containing protein [Planctomycetota bacterium]
MTRSSLTTNHLTITGSSIRRTTIGSALGGSKRSCRTGATAIVVVTLFVVMVLFSFFAINIANIQRHHAASQIACDLASRWGVDMISRGERPARVERQVRELAFRNWTVTQNLNKDWLRENRQNIEVNVEIGMAQPDESGVFTFVPGAQPFNAVRVDSSAFTSVVGFVEDGSTEDTSILVARDATSVALERDVCLVIDRSGSMTFDLETGDWMMDSSWHAYNAMSNSSSSTIQSESHQWWWYWPHPQRSRWSTLIPAMYGLADELQDTEQKEKFSIVSYSTEYARKIYDHSHQYLSFSMDAAEIETTPGFNYHEQVELVDFKYTWDKPVMGGTNIAAGIDEAVAVLTGPGARPNAFKTMIVMTDGQANSGRDPIEAARDAAQMGIEVHTVTFSSQADINWMKAVAEAGSGKHFHAPDGDALEEVFRRIANIPPAALID